MNKKKRSYTEEFKIEAVELANKIGFSQAGIELGINDNNIRKWSKKPSAYDPKSKLAMTDKDLAAENKRLKKENDYLKKINEVLKKSTAIFSSDEIRGLK